MARQEQQTPEGSEKFQGAQAAQGAQAPQSGVQQPHSGGTEMARQEPRGMAMPWRGDLWSPWGFRHFFDEFDRVFEQMRREFFGSRFGEEGSTGLASRGIGRLPQMEVEDTGNEIVVSAEMPGLGPDDVKLECSGDMLIIRGERREEQKQERGAYRSERRFFTQLPVPTGCNIDNANASFENGLLRIRLPKTSEASTRRIPISSEGDRKAVEADRKAA